MGEFEHRKDDAEKEVKGMKVVKVESGKKAEILEIESGLSSLQKMVGGRIQAIYPFEEMVALICNEDGKYENLPYNRVLRDDDGEIYDIVAGTFLIVGLGETDFTSLTDELADKFLGMYEKPERFIKMPGGGICVC